jgi:hypothetical protein
MFSNLPQFFLPDPSNSSAKIIVPHLIQSHQLAIWYKRKGTVNPGINKLSGMPWRRMGEWRYSFTILDLDTRWRWVVSFTPRPLYPQGISVRYPLVRRLDGPRSQPGRRGEEKILDRTETVSVSYQRKVGHYFFLEFLVFLFRICTKWRISTFSLLTIDY